MDWIWLIGLLGVGLLIHQTAIVQQWQDTLWTVHWTKCSMRHAANEALLATQMCDGGANELALRDKVNCAGARIENQHGIWWCTINARIESHSLTKVTQHLLESWYVFGVLLLVVYLAIKGYWKYSTSVRKHKHQLDAQIEIAHKFTLASAIGPSVQRIEENRLQKPQSSLRRIQPYQTQNQRHQDHFVNLGELPRESHWSGQ